MHGEKGSKKAKSTDKKQRGQSGGLVDLQETSGNRAVLRYAEAYNAARTYHSTWKDCLEPGEHGQGILAEGLRTDKGGTGLSTVSGFNNDIAYNQGTIHLTTPERGSYYDGMMGAKTRLRPMLPPERTVRHPKDPHGLQRPETDKGQLYRDKEDEFGSWITGEDIPPEHINFGSNLDLAESGPDEIFEVIAQHMVDPPPSTEELRQLHLEALDDGYISE